MVEQWILNFLTAVEIIFIILAIVIGGALIWTYSIAPQPMASLLRKELKGVVKKIAFEGVIAIALIIAILNWPYLANLAIAVWIIKRIARTVLDKT